ncbi:MAG TPA: hypothetical protein VMW71_00010 [Thermoplasmata archaeon]|nr:hypothetical protein [Thermoplasmata archaeon]
MSCIKDLLNDLCRDVEAELKPKATGFLTGWLVQNYLPQNWVFKTEQESVIFHVTKTGSATVKNGDLKTPDVIIEWDHDSLSTVLRTRSSAGISHPPRVSIRTSKGKAGYDQLRKRIGI